MADEAKMARKVPMKLYAMIAPMFLKKGFFFMLNPASKMMGGSSRIMNSSVKSVVKLLTYVCQSIKFMKAPAAKPRMVVRPASCKYL